MKKVIGQIKFAVSRPRWPLPEATATAGESRSGGDRDGGRGIAGIATVGDEGDGRG